MSDHNVWNVINQCNKGYWKNEIDKTVVNHTCPNCQSRNIWKLFQQQGTRKLIEQ